MTSVAIAIIKHQNYFFILFKCFALKNPYKNLNKIATVESVQ